MDFDGLYETYFDNVYQYIFYMVSSKELAEDLTQETFVRVFNSEFRGDAEWGTYIRQIARNLVYDHYRRKALIKWIPFVHNDEKEATDCVPHDWLVQEENRLELYEALKQLKPAQREVLFYRKIEELSMEETARILGWKITKVANTTRTAMLELTKLLGGGAHEFG